VGVGVGVGAGVGLGMTVGVGVGAGVGLGIIVGVAVGAGVFVGGTRVGVAVGALPSPPQAANRNVIRPIRGQTTNLLFRNIVGPPLRMAAIDLTCWDAGAPQPPAIT